MALNLEIWSVVIGLMELGCALTWNHDEQFVEGDFPYYPYTNRFNAYADNGDGLTDVRIRSNEFSGYKTAPRRRNCQGKRKPLYAFNKDSNKLIDATKSKGVEQQNFESIHQKLTHWPGRSRHMDEGGSAKSNSAGFGPKSTEYEKVAPLTSKKSTAESKHSVESNRLDTEKRFQKAEESGRLEALETSGSSQTTQEDSNGPTNLEENSAQKERKSDQSKGTPRKHKKQKAASGMLPNGGAIGPKSTEHEKVAQLTSKNSTAELKHAVESNRLDSEKSIQKAEESGRLETFETSGSSQTTQEDSNGPTNLEENSAQKERKFDQSKGTPRKHKKQKAASGMLPNGGAIGPKSTEHEKVAPLTSKKSTAELKHAVESNRLDSEKRIQKAEESGRLETLETSGSSQTTQEDSNGPTNLERNSAQKERKFDQPKGTTGKHKKQKAASGMLPNGCTKLKPNEEGQELKTLAPTHGVTKSAETSSADGPDNLNTTEPKSTELEPTHGDEKPANIEKAYRQKGYQGVKLANRLNRGNKKGTCKRTGKGQALSEKRKRRNSNFDASLTSWGSRNIGESHAKFLWAHGTTRNRTGMNSSRRKFTRENKPSGKNKKLTLIAPYETNYTGGGFRSTNPSSWLAKEIERFIRRKDHRWLDFMKNAGMDVKKHSTGASDAKLKSTYTKKPNSQIHEDTDKLKTDLLINRIDSLLADLNQFRSSVKNGWSDIKKTRETETGQKLMNDDAIVRRKHRLRRGIRFSRRRPAAGIASDLVENDLRDLKKNVVLYKSQLSDEDKQALKDMKLHIKVYVEKETGR